MQRRIKMYASKSEDNLFVSGIFECIKFYKF